MERRKVAGEKALSALKVPFASVMAEMGNPTIPKDAQPTFWPALARALDAAAHVKKGSLSREEMEEVIRFQVSRVIAKSVPKTGTSAGSGPMAGNSEKGAPPKTRRARKKRGKKRGDDDKDWIFRA